jgi:hypothetical protein
MANNISIINNNEKILFINTRIIYYQNQKALLETEIQTITRIEGFDPITITKIGAQIEDIDRIIGALDNKRVSIGYTGDIIYEEEK